MARHLALRSGNPALTSKIFLELGRADTANAMTIQGTVNKTGLALLLLMASATLTWNSPEASGLIWVGALGGFIVALITIFNKTAAPYTVPVYAVLEGLFLGGISRIFESMNPGIVQQAVFLTFGTLGALLLAYRSGLIKATENFKLGVTAATGGIAFVYLVSIVMGFFGIHFSMIHSSGPMGILFSAFVVVIAALNLVMDFDFIEEGAENGAPKYMEWYAAFGLLVTLIWLYLEILRLLAKLRKR